MRFAQAGAFVHFKMQFDEQAALKLMRGKFVDGEASALRDGANCFEQVFIAARARLDVNHYVRIRHDFLDVLLDGVARDVRLLEAGGARDADGDVDEIALAGAAHANALAAQDAFRVCNCCGDLLLQAAGSHVEQCVDRFFAEARADPDDDTGDGQGGERRPACRATGCRTSGRSRRR